MRHYEGFGLYFASDIDLAPMMKSEVRNADVQIIKGFVSKAGLNQPVVSEPFCQISPGEMWLAIPDVARFHVSGGNSIVVEPKTGASMQTINLFLLGSCMGAIMYQRNRLVIHGNAIRFNDEAVVFAGTSGAGKSTLAAAFVKRGYQVLSDDLSVVDEHGCVQPSYPQLKIWRDAANKLDIDITGLKPIGYQADKFAYPLQQQFYHKPLPIRAIYILHGRAQNSISIKALTGMEKLKPLKRHSYRGSFVEGLGLNSAHLKLCGLLAHRTRISKIYRPNQSFDIDALVELIEKDVERSHLSTE